MKPIVALINEWSEFTDEYAGHDLESFCKYYLAKKSAADNKSIDLPADADRQRGSLLRVMGRILSAHSLYMRAAMSTLDLPAPESFYYLNALSYLGEVRKSDLINYLFAETTTGMEAINKLVAVDMIKERTSPDDKRAKLIQLTPKGGQYLQNAYELAGRAAEITLHKVPVESIIKCYELLKDCETEQSKLAIELKNKTFEEMHRIVKS